MIKFVAIVQKFEKKGEKTGWTYIPFPAKIAEKLNPGSKVSFRVKGKLDGHAISSKALLPMGKGDFILPLKAELRKLIGKQKGEKVTLEVEVDTQPLQISKDLLACLKPEPAALAYFKALPPSHQHYFSIWVEGAKSLHTKTRRITITIIAMANKMTYREMLLAYREGEIPPTGYVERK